MENIKLCEVCGKEHNGSYGSGRFCSYSCKQKFSSVRGAAATAKLSKKNFDSIKCKCKFCGEDFESKISMKRHLQKCEKAKHTPGCPSKEGGWTCECGQNFKTRRLLNEHKKECSIRFILKRPHLNQYTKAKFLGLPKPEVSEETRKKIGDAHRGIKNSSKRIEVRKKISESMKKAHAEGRAWNIGQSRWNNEPSYPEKWFMKMLKNEFNFEEGKDYVREFPFHKFSLDFAWPDKKLCIEIDGKQHLLEEQRKRDNEKDKLLKEEGWKIFRIDWRNCYKIPKEYIQKAKEFLGLVIQLVE